MMITFKKMSILATAMVTAADTQVAKVVLNKRLKPLPVHPLTTEMVEAQQQIADLFKQIYVSQTIWSAHSPKTQD